MSVHTRIRARETYEIEDLRYRAVYTDAGMSEEFDGTLGDWAGGALTVSGTVSLLAAPSSAPIYDLTTRPGSVLLQPRAVAGNYAAIVRELSLADGEEVIVSMSSPFAQGAGGNNEISYGVTLNDSASTPTTGSTFDQFHWDGGNGTIQWWNGSTVPSTLTVDYLPGRRHYWRFLRNGDDIHVYFSMTGDVWCGFADVDTVARGHTHIWIRYAVTGLSFSSIAAPLEVRWVRHMTTVDSPFPLVIS